MQHILTRTHNRKGGSMKAKYSDAEIEIIIFDLQDVIVSSPGTPEENLDENELPHDRV